MAVSKKAPIGSLDMVLCPCAVVLRYVLFDRCELLFFPQAYGVLPYLYDSLSSIPYPLSPICMMSI